MSIHLDQPLMLLVAAVALPLIVVGLFALRGADRLRRVTVITLRTLLVAILALLLAAPYHQREHDGLTVIALVDVSASVQRFARIPQAGAERRSYVQHLQAWLADVAEARPAADRFGLVVFDGEAVAVVAPTAADTRADDLDVSMVPGTSIEDAIRLGLAMLPADTARRLVLISDGNETIGDAFEAALTAAGGEVDDASARLRRVPIDVVSIDYRVPGDVQISRIDAPWVGQSGQAVTVRVVMQSTHETTGILTLRREGQPIDINGDATGRGRRIAVPAGESVHAATVVLADTPVNRFEAAFDPDDTAVDALPDNNRAEAFTPTPGKGRILIVEAEGSASGKNALARTLALADLPVLTIGAAALPADLLALQNYELIILDGVPAYEVPAPIQEMLARYVHDLGGGLIMVGGENSFGAGGWNGTKLEEVLPLELDPPKEMRLPQAALVLVIDQSGSMNRRVAGARATQQQVANEAAAMAIESLRAESLVGVVTFHSLATELVSLRRNDDPRAIAARVRTITSGGGTDLAPALRRAEAMLRNVKAEKKRVVCLSDGRSESSPEELKNIVTDMFAADIRLTTIAVGDEADHDTLRTLADIGQGTFYPVYNPKALPRVLVDSVQIINKPLIKEAAFVPRVLPTGSTITAGMQDAPPLLALVVTAPRDDPRAVVEMAHPDGEPLLARWQAGLGKVAAFTSDAFGPWTASWEDWDTAASFWTQLVRTTARPATSHDAELVTVIDDGRLRIALEASGDDGFLDFLQVEGTVYPPRGDPVAVRLRQTAPGRYETSVPARDAGNYIVALNPRRGSRQLSPVIGGTSRPTGDEFRRYTTNTALLERIRTVTGGRELSVGLDEAGAAAPAASSAIDLFDRTGMPTSVSFLPARRELLWIALALLLLDVAARRIAWSGAALRRLAAAALRRVTPAHVHGTRAATTLGSLREVRAQVDERQPRAAAAPAKLEKPAPARMPTRAAPTPEPSRVAAALGALLGRSRPKPPPPGAVPGDDRADQADKADHPDQDGSDDPGAAKSGTPAAPTPPAPAAPTDAGNEGEEEGEGSSETTRGLLAAKRRARDRM